MVADEIALVREHCHMEHFLKSCLAFVEGGPKPLDYFGNPDITKVERGIVNKIASIIDDNQRLRLELRDAQQAV